MYQNGQQVPVLCRVWTLKVYCFGVVESKNLSMQSWKLKKSEKILAYPLAPSGLGAQWAEGGHLGQNWLYNRLNVMVPQ